MKKGLKCKINDIFFFRIRGSQKGGMGGGGPPLGKNSQIIPNFFLSAYQTVFVEPSDMLLIVCAFHRFTKPPRRLVGQMGLLGEKSSEGKNRQHPNASCQKRATLFKAENFQHPGLFHSDRRVPISGSCYLLVVVNT